MHVHLHLGGVANDVWPRAIKEAEGAEGVGLSDLLRLLLGLLVLLRMALEYGRLCTVKGITFLTLAGASGTLCCWVAIRESKIAFCICILRSLCCSEAAVLSLKRIVALEPFLGTASGKPEKNSSTFSMVSSGCSSSANLETGFGFT